MGIANRFRILIGIILLGFLVLGFFGLRAFRIFKGRLESELETSISYINTIEVSRGTQSLLYSQIRNLKGSLIQGFLGMDMAVSELDRVGEISSRIDELEERFAELEIKKPGIDALRENLQSLNQSYQIAVENIAGIADGEAREAELRRIVESTEAAENAVIDSFEELQSSLESQLEAFSGNAPNRIDATYQAMMRLGIVLLIIALFVAAFLSIIISRRISVRFNDLLMQLQDISTGANDLSSRVDIASKDESGRIANTINTFILRVSDIVESIKESARQSIEVKTELEAAAQKTLSELVQISTNLRGINEQMRNMEEQIAGSSAASDEINQSIQSLNSQIEDQVSAVSQSTASVEEMIASINNVAEITGNRKEAAMKLVDTAARGSDRLQETNQALHDVIENIDQIQEMLNIITNISGQTNLLSMNAAIEAAHAGEAGKGFAVVAEEIRKLADTARENSQGIGKAIRDIIGTINKTGENADATITAFEEVNREVREVANAFDEINASAGELSAGSNEILKAMSSLNEVSSKVNEGSDEISRGAADVTKSMQQVTLISSQVNERMDEIQGDTNNITSQMRSLAELTQNLDLVTEALNNGVNSFSAGGEEIREVSLTEELSSLRDSVHKQVDADTLEVEKRALKAIADTGIEEELPSPGEKAPDFSLVNQANEIISLSEVLREGPAVLNFYRGSWCPFCNLEINALGRYLPQIRDYGARLLAISSELPDSSLSLIEKYNLEYDVLYDRDNQIAHEYDLVYTVPEELKETYRKNGNEFWELPIPATFIVDEGGTIVYSFGKVDYTQRTDPEEIINVLKVLKEDKER